jgi:uncharacterized membrane protein YdjX (TVP38/TMEM64 family)
MTSGAGRAGYWRPLALLAAIVTFIILARLLGLGERLESLRELIEPLGFWGPFAFAVIYAGATVAVLPGSIMSVIAGSLFGPVTGVLAVYAGSLAGASIAFLIARYFARDAVARWISTKDRLLRLDELTGEFGSVIVAFTRLVPLFPFVLLNYGYGLTRVSFRTYFLWTSICIIPGIILFVVGSAAIFEGTAEGRVPWALVAIVAVTVAVVIMLARMARRKIEGGRNDADAGDIEREA